MPYTGSAAPRFNKLRKRLARKIRETLNQVIAQILQDPHRGDRKKGSLRHTWVEKFKAGNIQWLLAYEIDEKRDIVHFTNIGPHENFYRDLQKYLDETAGKKEPLDEEGGS